MILANSGLLIRAELNRLSVWTGLVARFLQ